MATLQELRALKETVPGIQIIETGDRDWETIHLKFHRLLI